MGRAKQKGDLGASEGDRKVLKAGDVPRAGRIQGPPSLPHTVRWPQHAGCLPSFLRTATAAQEGQCRALRLPRLPEPVAQPSYSRCSAWQAHCSSYNEESLSCQRRDRGTDVVRHALNGCEREERRQGQSLCLRGPQEGPHPWKYSSKVGRGFQQPGLAGRIPDHGRQVGIR